MPEIAGLYVLIDPVACRGRNPVDVARAALDGGAKMLQWRDKVRDKGAQLGDARAIYALCRQHDALFIINDHADLALALAKDGLTNLGVHVGQSDLPVEVVCGMVPPYMLVGASTNNPDEALAARRAGASYVAVGDLFGTTAKTGTRPASPAVLASVKQAVGDFAVIGIGGINLSNVAQVIEAGADAVAVISAVCGADDPRSAAGALVEAIDGARARSE